MRLPSGIAFAYWTAISHFPEAVMQNWSAVALIALIAIAAPVRAQTTVQRDADVLNRPQTNPVTETRRVTSTTVIVPQREFLVIERVHGQRHGWWKHSQYRVITVYYD